jgi:hypothetical protein
MSDLSTQYVVAKVESLLAEHEGVTVDDLVSIGDWRTPTSEATMEIESG